MLQDKELTFYKRDEYNRRRIADRLIRLLSSDLDISPIIIDGRWGSGKTEFCHKTVNLIEEVKSETKDTPEDDQDRSSGEAGRLKAIYVDAFRADHTDMPLLTLLAAVIQVLPNDKEKSIRKAAIPLLNFSLKTAGKAGISWILKQNISDISADLESEIKKASGEAFETLTNSLLTEQIQSEGNMKALRKSLEEASENNKLVLVVDELDRCKPSFSISMLEVIKHVFDINSISIILVTNREQLEESIRHEYGSINSSKYLEKFFKYQITLSNTYKSGYKSTPITDHHIYQLIKKSKTLNETDLSVKPYLKEFISKVSANKNLTLRDVERLIFNLEILHTAEPAILNSHNLIYKVLALSGVIIFTFHNKTAEKIISKNYSTERIQQEIKEIFPSHEDESIVQRNSFILRRLLVIETYPNSKKEVEKLEGDDRRAIEYYFEGISITPPNLIEALDPLIDTIRIMGLNND